MSIRLKLIITYIFCVLFSAGVIVVTMFVGTTRFVHTAVSEIIKNSSIDGVGIEIVDLLAELKIAEDTNGELLIDEIFMNEINDRLQFFNSGLVVLFDNKFMDYTEFEDSDIITSKLFVTSIVRMNLDEKLKNISPQLAKDEDRIVNVIGPEDGKRSFEIGGNAYFFIDRGFVVDGEPVIYFFVADISGIQDLNTNVKKGVVFSIVVLVILMILPVILLVQFDIIRPLKQLEKGAVEIGKGNLDFKIKTRSKNEVGRVLISYEKMREELKKSIEIQVKYENNRKELISSISHDLKTPMTSIKGYVEGILDGVANTDEKRERYLKVIHQKSLDMDKLIDDLFTFSKFDLNKLPFEFADINMETFVRDVSDELIYEYSEGAKIELTVINSSKLKGHVTIDVQQMKRVILNLVQNSIKYNINENKKVELIYENKLDVINLTIKDNGIGMSPEELENAFEMFYRSDDSRNTKTGGSGLGLAIVKQIILEHNGKIIAKSSKSKGSSITICLKKIVEA